MASGGKRTGAGRKAGSRNKRTEAKLREVKASGMTPLEYLISIMRDETKDEGRRVDAAKAAAPYVHARLSNVDMSVSQQEKAPEEMTEAEILAELNQSLAADGAAEAQASSPKPAGVH